nr:hypothetical protein [Tanacetum cinerariifolium]
MGNKQPLDRDITFTTPDEGTAKTTPRLEGLHSRAILLFEDKALESKKDILRASEQIDDNPYFAESQHQSSPPQEDKHTSSTAPHTEASDTDYSNQTDQLVEDYMSSLEKISSTINDLYKGLEVITPLLKDITNSIKDDPAINKKIEESSKTLAKISTETTEIFSLVRIFDFSTL